MRLRLLGEHARAISELERREEEICCEMAGEAGDSGTARITLNHGQSEICWELNVVTATKPVAAHIHVGSASVAGPIVVPLSAPVGGFSSECTSVSRGLIEAIRDNPSGYYVNVHTTARPAGAIRGQLHG